MSFRRPVFSPVTSSITRFVTHSSSSIRPQCPHILRSFSSTAKVPQSSKRELQTATAYRPHTLPTPPFPSAKSGDSAETAGVVADLPQHAPRPPAPAPSASSNQSNSNSRQDSASVTSNAAASTPSTSSQTSSQKPKRSKLRPRKAAMSLTPTAISRLRELLNQPEPKMIRVGVRNRGCSGLSYHLEYVEKPGSFDEVVEQDGVKVLIDSKALFSIIGSEMDWQEDKLSSRFVFRNPNIKDQCGCGESFMV